MANSFANSVKLLTAVSLLASPAGTTIKKLMARLGISRRTAFRLLAALEELGIPLTDEQPKAHSEKTYRLMEPYVIKLPNMALLNPGLTGQEIETVISILDLCGKLCQICGTMKLNAICEKITAIKPKDGKEQTHDRHTGTKRYYR
jgi:predicted DNA-binding transcriptional regulator YafY